LVAQLSKPVTFAFQAHSQIRYEQLQAVETVSHKTASDSLNVPLKTSQRVQTDALQLHKIISPRNIKIIWFP